MAKYTYYNPDGSAARISAETPERAAKIAKSMGLSAATTTAKAVAPVVEPKVEPKVEPVVEPVIPVATKYKYIGPEGNVFTVSAVDKTTADKRAQSMQPGATVYSGAEGAGSVVTPKIPEVPEISEIPEEEVSLTDKTSRVATTTATDYTQYFTSLANELATTRTSLESAYQQQIDSLKSQQEASQAKIDSYIAKSTGALEDVKKLTQPWQADLEKAERTRLKTEENYFANQSSIKELETLLNRALTDIQSAEGVTGLGAIRTPRVNKIKEDYQARTGIIEAVMAARNNQISVANNLIDRTATSIQNDKNSQLTYYNAVLGFYDTLRGEEGNKLITLTAQENTYVQAQISLLENDMKTAQTTVDYVKQLMIDPNTAQAMESAGVTMNDSVAQINAKLAAYAYQKEVQDTSNTMATNGYTQLLPQEVANKPANEVMTLTDSKGNKTYFWKEVEGIVPETKEVGGVLYQWDKITKTWKPSPGVIPVPDISTQIVGTAETGYQTVTIDNKTGKIISTEPISGAGGVTPGTDEEIDIYARQLMAGTILPSQVPQKIRGQVLIRQKDFVKEDLRNDISIAKDRQDYGTREDLIGALQPLYKELSKDEIATEVYGLIPDVIPITPEEKIIKGAEEAKQAGATIKTGITTLPGKTAEWFKGQVGEIKGFFGGLFGR